MIRGTTPKHTFTLPFNIDQLKTGYVTYKQITPFGEIITLEKDLSDVEINEDEIIVNLTQEETLLFVASYVIEIQLKVKTLNDEVFVSQIFIENVEQVLKEEEI